VSKVKRIKLSERQKTILKNIIEHEGCYYGACEYCILNNVQKMKDCNIESKQVLILSQLILQGQK
jgi:uncharacterized protein YheU (UPF0270 family)